MIKRFILIFSLAMIAGIFTATTVNAETPTPTPTPASLSMTKSSPVSVTNLYTIVQYDIVITNSGGTKALGVSLYDSLPTNLVSHWEIGLNTFSNGCNIDTSLILRCTGDVDEQKIFQNGSNSVTVNGITSVSVWGFAVNCGLTTNSAVYIYNGILSSQVNSTVQVLCPATPVPTATQTPLPTSTPIPPTNTPIPPTSTPIILVVTATPTPTNITFSTSTPFPRVAPGPPNTGSGVTSTEPIDYFALFSLGGLAVVILGAVALALYTRYHSK